MLQTSYSNKKLLQLAKTNYKKLSSFCETLLEEGYWEQAESILNKSIFDILDLYVQSVLIKMAVYCGRFHYDEREFVIAVSHHNIAGCTLEGDMDDVFFMNANRVISSPPILLQLCGVRDVEKKTDFTIRFFDSLLNIILCMADLNHKKDTFVTKFVQDYYQKIQVFINQEIMEEYINPRYIFKKLSSDYHSEEISIVKKTNKGNEKERVFAKEKLECVKEQLEERQIQEIREELKDRNGPVLLEQLLDELDSLIGLEGVKEEMRSLINLIKVRKLRESYRMPTIDMTYHMVFTGNPGTGKTTVARLVAKIYKELGILTKGNLVETDRAGLVAGYVGQTALKAKEVIESAIGGVLFIDEAYALTNNTGSNDFGMESIDTLVKMMEDNRENLVVIVAGYNEEMKEFLKANTGLVSRFNKFVNFPDYTINELMEILDSMVAKAGFELEEDGRETIEYQLVNMQADQFEIFGNARGIRNVFEKIVMNQANRIVTYTSPTQEQLVAITKNDIYNIL